MKGWTEGKARDPLKEALWVLKLDLVPGPVFLLLVRAALEVVDTRSLAVCSQRVCLPRLASRSQAALDHLSFMDAI